MYLVQRIWRGQNRLLLTGNFHLHLQIRNFLALGPGVSLHDHGIPARSTNIEMITFFGGKFQISQEHSCLFQSILNSKRSISIYISIFEAL